MWWTARVTLAQQLMLLVIGLVMGVQIANVIVLRVAEVQQFSTQQQSRHLAVAGRAMRSLLDVPEDQKASFAGTLSNPSIQVEWGDLRPLLSGDARRPEAEAEALAWYRKAGLPVNDIVMTVRGYPSPPPPPGISSERSRILSLGEPPRTILVQSFDRPRLRVWALRERPAPPDNFLNYIRTHPRAEVHRISLRHEESGTWLSVYQLRRLPPVNAAYTKLLTSSLVSVFIAAIVLIIGHRVMRPLRRLSREAERLGRGEVVERLAVEGPRDTREIIATFNRMNERITQAVDYQIGLLRSLAHDLSGPLAGVKRLVGSVGPDTTRDQIEARLERVQSIVDAIMAFSRAVMRDGDFQSVDLVQLLDVVIDERVELGGDAAMEDSEPIMATCRVSAIQRCLSNLVDNACKYGGQARATVRRDGDEAVVTIDDAGPGIPDGDLERVFEPFQRLADSTQGNGLGLAIAKTIVVDQGGSIRLLNRPEGGLRAELRLPLERVD
ncbi:MAG: ATP-binding protein [Rhodobacter sp.]|nr:ATP-binding protein [Rhodobacter sp.]